MINIKNFDPNRIEIEKSHRKIMIFITLDISQ